MEAVIRYYNVYFYLYFRDGWERQRFSYLAERISSGERMAMKDIYGWCVAHGISYRTRFRYRPDFPVRANLWNFYSYIRGRADMRRAGREAAHVQ